MRIAIASSEAAPFAKTGGLADMVGALAAALGDQGADTTLIVPAHRSVLDRNPEATGLAFDVPVAGAAVRADILRGCVGRTPVHFIRADRFFDRDHLYGPPGADYGDNADRFAFFARAVLQLLSAGDPPDVIHVHDWQSGLAAALLRLEPEHYPRLASARTLLTVHNVGYQGLFDADAFRRLGLDAGACWPRFEFYGRTNYLKAGVSLADLVTTVSPTYAEEIKTAAQGCGLDGVFRERAGQLVGILNGVDYSIWDPAADGFIRSPYTAGDLTGKRDCKVDLQRRAGLPVADRPVVSVVARLAEQKGIDILLGAIGELLARDLQFVLLGTGEARYESPLRDIGQRHPGQAAIHTRFDEGLAHVVEAGSDIFLMPSRYEPCGLNQLYSLKYGTVPVVRATGGLRDSVSAFDPATRQGTGFLFDDYSPGALLDAVDRALDCYRQPDVWQVLMRNAMSRDFSVQRVAALYLDAYRRLAGSAGS